MAIDGFGNISNMGNLDWDFAKKNSEENEQHNRKATMQSANPQNHPANIDRLSQKRQYKCQACCDSGLILNAENQAVPCTCLQGNRLLVKRAAANILPALANMTMANFDLSYYPDNQVPQEYHRLGKTYREFAQNAKNKAEDFLRVALYNKHVKGLMFQGQVGSGKTHLAAAIANELLAHNCKVLFLVVPDFLDDLRSSYNLGGEFTEVEIMDRAKNARVLILDDLGSHNFSVWTQNKLFSLINYRLNQELPIIITTNIDLPNLTEVLGARVVSRIIAGCDACLLPVPKDIRYIKNQEG